MGSSLDSSLAVAMYSFTIIAFALLLSASISSGGVVRRSIQSKPYKNAKELLSMKGAGEAIKTSFESAGSNLEALADELDKEVTSIADLAAYINGTETEKMSEALAEAKNIQSLMNDQRTELSGLAKQTISKSERIIKKFKEMVAGSRTVDRGMRSVLRDMRALLRFSEGKLKTAKETILTLREKINKVFATLRVFEGMIKAAKEKDARLSAGLKAKTAEEILNGITTDIMTGVDGYRKAKRGDETMSVVTSILGGVTRLTTSIIKAVNRPDVGPKLNSALKATGKAIEIVKQQKDSMEKEVELIIVWKDAVETVKQDVFAGDLKDKREEDAQDLYEEIEGLIEDGDVEELYEAFNGLKGAAQSYLSHIERVCSICTE